MFRIKICGVKDAEIAAFCSSIGVDAIGLNFYSKSKRCVSTAEAESVVDATASSVLKVGLFVNQDADEIAQRAVQHRLDAIQLHGDETIDLMSRLSDHACTIPVVRAVRLSSRNELDAMREIEEWSSGSHSGRVGALLLDPYVEEEFGGTGQCIDWTWLATRELPTDKPLILAGGLTPENVAEAIATVKPYGVDVAGGVEITKGCKDKAKISQFYEAAAALINRS